MSALLLIPQIAAGAKFKLILLSEIGHAAAVGGESHFAEPDLSGRELEIHTYLVEALGKDCSIFQHALKAFRAWKNR